MKSKCTLILIILLLQDDTEALACVLMMKLNWWRDKFYQAAKKS